MASAYRNDRDAALHRADSLQRENAALRERLAQLEHPTASPATRAQVTGPVVTVTLSAVLFLAGAVIYAGMVMRVRGDDAYRSRCPHRMLERAAPFDRGGDLTPAKIPASRDAAPWHVIAR